MRLPREILRDCGSILKALSAFPNSSRILLDLSRSRKSPLDSSSGSDSDEHMVAGDKDGGDEDEEDDAALVAGALDALAALRHPVTSLVVLNLSSPMPMPSATTLGYLASCGLSELEFRDVSIQRSASDGASNLLRALPGHQPPGESLADSIRARGAAMVRFACSLPALRRLSLCNAAFSAGDVAALGGLTQLEELSLDGAMECGGDSFEAAHTPSSRPKLFLDASAAAAPAYKHLLAALRRLRRLRLPMAIAARPQCELLDSDDDDDDGTGYCFEDGFGSGRGVESAGVRNAGILGQTLCSVSCSDTPMTEPESAGRWATGSWSFPPHLEELTIPLCALNGPVFRAACGSNSGGCSGCGGLRALHVTCAPGYTVWEGSFLNGERDFEALSRLAPSLESLHLSLELGGSGRGALRRDRLRSCLRRLRALTRLRVLQLSETRQPVCFAIHKSTAGRPDMLSSLLDDAPRPCAFDEGFAALPRLGGRPGYGARRLWSDDHVAPAGPAAAATPLPSFISTASSSASPSPWLRTPSCSPPSSASSSFPSSPSSFPSDSPPSSPSSPSLDSLLAHWPDLQTLVVCGQRAVRSSRGGRTRLELPQSLEQLAELGLEKMGQEM